jgi:Fe-S cluster assembly ATP-binding protein
MLKIEKLKIESNGKEILKGIDFQIKRGEVQALLGPNASGKSTLAQAISGNPKYKISQGKIIFNGKNINRLSPEKRVKLGIVLSLQAPPSIKGVKLSQLLDKISHKGIPGIKGAEGLLDREINLDFSGGERKISELLQILSLSPKLAIFDEIDSGLDIKKLEQVAGIIKKELIAKKTAVLIITHSGQILNFLKPKLTNVIIDGKITCRSKDYKKVLRAIKKYGYEKCKKCQLLAN